MVRYPASGCPEYLGAVQVFAGIAGGHANDDSGVERSPHRLTERIVYVRINRHSPKAQIEDACLHRRTGRSDPVTIASNTVQLVVTFASLGGALISTVLNWRTQDEAITAVGSIAIDGPTYLIWTILLVFSAASFLLFAERKVRTA